MDQPRKPSIISVLTLILLAVFWLGGPASADVTAPEKAEVLATVGQARKLEGTIEAFARLQVNDQRALDANFDLVMMPIRQEKIGT